MISQALAQQAVHAIGLLAGEYWRDLECEVQDDATFLLIQADARAESALQPPDDVRAEIVKSLTAILPEHTGDSRGNWMVIVFHEGHMRTSLMASEV